MSILAILIIGLIAGWLAGLIMKGGGFGMIGNMVVGVLGALISGFVLPQLGVSVAEGWIGSIIHATIGAVILLFVIGLLRRT